MPQEAAPFLISLLILIAAIAAFFILGRGRYAQFGAAQIVLRIIAALPLLISGIWMHFLHTNQATAAMPPIYPSPGLLVRFSGICELLGAIGLFVPFARRSAALWIAILMVVVFPVNIAIAGQTYFGVQMPGVTVRLIGQIIYIWIVLLAGYGLPGVTNSQRR